MTKHNTQKHAKQNDLNQLIQIDRHRFINQQPQTLQNKMPLN